MSADWRRALALSTALGVSSLLYRWVRSRETWLEVGTLDSIQLYPIKSAAPLSVESAVCCERGLSWQSDIVTIADRMFVVYDGAKHVVTSRTHPELLRVHTLPGSRDGTVLLTHPNMQEPVCLQVPTDLTPNVHIGMKFPTTEREELPARDCGDEVARWLSLAIHCPTARLGYWPPHHLRDISKPRARELSVFTLLHNKYTGAFSNLSSYLLLNKSSFEDLKERLGDRGTVYTENFRANLIVSGAEPFEEDHWSGIKVGNTAVLRIIKKCVRCVLVTINPFTLEKDPHLEPLKTLKTYRQLKDSREREIEGDSPVMGSYVGLEHAGTIKTGDKVYATIRRQFLH